MKSMRIITTGVIRADLGPGGGKRSGYMRPGLSSQERKEAVCTPYMAHAHHRPNCFIGLWLFLS